MGGLEAGVPVLETGPDWPMVTQHLKAYFRGRIEHYKPIFSPT